MTLKSIKKSQFDFQRPEYDHDLNGAVRVIQSEMAHKWWIIEALNHRSGEDNTMQKVSWRSVYFFSVGQYSTVA